MSIHISSSRTYGVIFAALLLLTITTVLVAYTDLGPVNNIVALSIAVTKMVLVILFYLGEAGQGYGGFCIDTEMPMFEPTQWKYRRIETALSN